MAIFSFCKKKELKEKKKGKGHLVFYAMAGSESVVIAILTQLGLKLLVGFS